MCPTAQPLNPNTAARKCASRWPAKEIFQDCPLFGTFSAIPLCRQPFDHLPKHFAAGSGRVTRTSCRSTSSGNLAGSGGYSSYESHSLYVPHLAGARPYGTTWKMCRNRSLSPMGTSRGTIWTLSEPHRPLPFTTHARSRRYIPPSSGIGRPVRSSSRPSGLSYADMSYTSSTDPRLKNEASARRLPLRRGVCPTLQYLADRHPPR